MLLAASRVIINTLRHSAIVRLRDARRSGGAKRPLRIGVDIRPFYEPLTGIGWYLHHLLQEFGRRDDVELFLFGDARLTDAGPRLHAPIPPNATVCWFDLRGLPVDPLARRLSAAAYLLWIKMTGCDVMFGSNYFLPRLLGAVARRRVITVHDLTYHRFPALLQRETLDNLEAIMPREIAHADAVVCVSDSTRRDLLDAYDIDPSRAVTIHSGLAAPPAAEPLELPQTYILFVSTIEPRKNLGVLLDVFERLRTVHAWDGALVVVGKIGWKSAEIVSRLRGPGVVHLDYLQPGQLATAYRNAGLFVFPSIYEGFGFPLLEAMAAGVPSIAARSSSLPEIGGDAALYFEPHDPRELERQILRVFGDAQLRATLVARGVERAASFRWDRAAEETLDVLRRAAGR